MPESDVLQGITTRPGDIDQDIRLESAHLSVSYTHLDVYKRQTYVFIANNSKRDTKVKKTSFATSNTDISGKRAFCPVTSNNDTNSGKWIKKATMIDMMTNENTYLFFIFIFFMKTKIVISSLPVRKHTCLLYTSERS